MNIVVLAGGLSPERNISLSSGSQISNALTRNGHKVIMLDLCEKINVEIEDIFEQTYKNYKNRHCFYDLSTFIHDEEIKGIICQPNGPIMNNSLIPVCQSADVVFLALHGSVGENGQIQACFDMLGINYTGTGFAGSMLAMDKNLSKIIMKNKNIKTPNWFFSNDGCMKNNNMHFPYIVKPNSCGSSLGISVADSQASLQKALKCAKQFQNEIIVEEKIIGKEYSIGILGEKALPVIEIIPDEEIFSYKTKYQEGIGTEICPANLNSDDSKELQKIALNVHKALGLRDYSRIDFMIDQKGRKYCLEANSLPGMTPVSLLPKEAQVAGISYSSLCERIVEFAVERNKIIAK